MKEIFRNKVAWVIGASSGIGYELAKLLATNGARIIASGRREEKLKQLASTSPNIISLTIDLTDTKKILSKIKTATEVYNQIDMVFFCAGLSQRTFAESTPLKNTRAIMETNFFSSVTIAKELLPVMKQNSGGRFVILSSIMGRFGAQQRSSYSASKHALHGYFESLRAEEWKNNIRVTLAILGYIDTEFSKQALIENGESYNKIDKGQQNGMPAEECAAQIIKGIQQDKEELLIGGWEKYATFLKRFTPRLLSKILRNKDIN